MVVVVVVVVCLEEAIVQEQCEAQEPEQERPAGGRRRNTSEFLTAIARREVQFGRYGRMYVSPAIAPGRNLSVAREMQSMRWVQQQP